MTFAALFEKFFPVFGKDLLFLLGIRWRIMTNRKASSRYITKISLYQARIDSSPVPVSGKAWYIGYSVRAIRKSQEETHDYAKYAPLSRPSHIKKATETWSHPVFRTVFGGRCKQPLCMIIHFPASRKSTEKHKVQLSSVFLLFQPENFVLN